ncbi:MAG TPA: YggS family pyridoxal phosphate-dependent enzyme [Thermodesulfobacteriota bacterium]
MSGFAERLSAVRARIDAAARRAGRDPAEVRLVAVSKLQPVSALAEALLAGQTCFGENYVQEAVAKQAALAEHPDPAVRRAAAGAEWHLVGPLQRNKARDAVRHFALVHSVDRESLGEALARRAEAEGRSLPILVQVNISGEATKAGVAPEEAARLIERLLDLPGLSVRGLMAIPAPASSPEAARAPFAAMRQLRDRLVEAGLPRTALAELSMGMSDDFEVAVEEGATLVRVGTALFGQRPPK